MICYTFCNNPSRGVLYHLLSVRECILEKKGWLERASWGRGEEEKGWLESGIRGGVSIGGCYQEGEEDTEGVTREGRGRG